MRTLESEWQLQEAARRNAGDISMASAEDTDFRRYAFIARVLASQPAFALPEDFAVQVAALAEARSRTRRWSWSDCALLGAFVAMVGVCVAGWFQFGSERLDSSELLAKILTAASEPWLATGIASLALIQALAFRRRTTT